MCSSFSNMALSVNELTIQGVDITCDKDSGVFKKIISEGLSAENTDDNFPNSGSEVSVFYSGYLQSNGEKFDDSNGIPFKFVLDDGKVIKGWDTAVFTMKKNEKSRFYLNSAYAYGKNGSPPKIGSNADLIFDIELIDWKDKDITNDGKILKKVLTKSQSVSTPNEGSSIKAHIRGQLGNFLFDERDVEFSLFENGKEFNIPLGVEKTIETMKKGEKARVIIEHEYGFQDKGCASLNVPPNSTLTYEIYLSNFEKAKETWEMSLEEKIAACEKYKCVGNDLFNKKKHDEALAQYKKSIKYIDNVWKEEEKKITSTLKISIHLNLAAVKLQLKMYAEAIDDCDEVLKIDGQSVKALFRKGQALLASCSLDFAINVFKQCLVQDPKNTLIISKIQECNNLIMQYQERNKRIFSKAFKSLNFNHHPNDVSSNSNETNNENGHASDQKNMQNDTSQHVTN